jgi:hypothetical protein
VAEVPDSIEIRLYRPGDEVGITRLFKEVFGREMSIEEWRWKYVRNSSRKVYSSVAVHKDMGIVGHYGGICFPLVYKGRPAHGLAICDVMIHPRFRGIKTLRRLSYLVPHEAVKDGIIMGYGFPNKSTLLKPALSLGIYEHVEDVVEGNKETNSYNDSIRFMFKFFPIDYSDIRIDQLWEACKTNLSLAVVRNRDYLKWRYQRHPFFQYELWGLKTRLGHKLRGFTVLRREAERMLVIDFLCMSDMMEPLFHKIENFSFVCGKKNLTLWFPGYLQDILTGLGFSIKPSGTCIPRTTHESTLTKDEMAGVFFYTMGDTDFL